MRKFAILLLSLVLCISMFPIAAYATSAASYVLTLHIGSLPLELPAAPSHTLPRPSALNAGEVFAGWYAPATGNKAAVFLPAGATVTEDIATELTAVFVRMSTRADAEVRLVDGDEGVRFVTDINREDFARLALYSTALSMGTLIVRKESYNLVQSAYWRPQTNGVLSHETVAILGAPWNNYLDVVTTGSYTETRNTFSIAGSVSQIPSKMLCQNFVGVGYVKLTYTNGAVGYVYADYSTEGETRLYALAATAFGDRVAVQDEEHPYKTAAGYTAYDPSQIAFMQGVLDRVVNLTFVRENNTWKPVILPNVKAYNAPYTIVSSANNNEFARFVLVVKQDRDYRFDEDFFILLEDGNLRYVYEKESYVVNDICSILPEDNGRVMTVDFKGNK